MRCRLFLPMCVVSVNLLSCGSTWLHSLLLVTLYSSMSFIRHRCIVNNLVLRQNQVLCTHFHRYIRPIHNILYWASTSEYWRNNKYEQITEFVMEHANIQSACAYWVPWLQVSCIKQNMFSFVQETCTTVQETYTRKILLQVGITDMQVSCASFLYVCHRHKAKNHEGSSLCIYLSRADCRNSSPEWDEISLIRLFQLFNTRLFSDSMAFSVNSVATDY